MSSHIFSHKVSFIDPSSPNLPTALAQEATKVTAAKQSHKTEQQLQVNVNKPSISAIEPSVPHPIDMMRTLTPKLTPARNALLKSKTLTRKSLPLPEIELNSTENITLSKINHRNASLPIPALIPVLNRSQSTMSSSLLPINTRSNRPSSNPCNNSDIKSANSSPRHNRKSYNAKILEQEYVPNTEDKIYSTVQSIIKAIEDSHPPQWIDLAACKKYLILDFKAIKTDQMKQYSLFSHINCEKFIQGNKNFEGANPCLTKANLLDVLNQCIRKFQSKNTYTNHSLNKKLQDILNKIASSYYTACLFYKIQNAYELSKLKHSDQMNTEQKSKFDRDHDALKDIVGQPEQALALLKSTVQLICSAVASIEIGKSILIDGGYLSPEQAHSMLYEVTRTGNSEYAFTVYNTGNGIYDHHAKKSVLKSKPATAFYIPDLSQSEIAKKELWQQLVTITTVPLPTHSADHLYKQIKTLGTHSPTKKFFAPQHSGVCSWKSLMTYMHHKLDDIEYKKFQVKMSCMSIEQFIQQQNKEQISFDNFKNNMLRYLSTKIDGNIKHLKSNISPAGETEANTMPLTTFSTLYQQVNKQGLGNPLLPQIEARLLTAALITLQKRKRKYFKLKSESQIDPSFAKNPECLRK